MRQNSSHHPQLDGFRGLALLLVLFQHETILNPEGPLQAIWFRLFSGTWYAVDVFFVLSGFLITTLLYRAKGSQNYFKNFYARRFLRILPLYYAVLTFAFFILPHFSHPKIQSWSPILNHQGWYWGFLSNVFIAMQGRWSHPVLDVSWTLAIEEQFYLIWPFLVCFLSAKALRRLCIFGMFLSFLLRAYLVNHQANGWLVYVITPTRVDAIFAGVLAALHVECSAPIRTRFLKNSLWVLFVLLEISILIGGYDQIQPQMQIYGYSLVAIFVGVLLLNVRLAQPHELLYQIFASRFMRFLGKYSYGIYFTHLPIRAVIRDYVMPASSFGNFGHPLIGQLLFYVVATIPTILAGYLTFHLLEKHFLKLKILFEEEKTAKKTPSLPAWEISTKHHDAA